MSLILMFLVTLFTSMKFYFIENGLIKVPLIRQSTDTSNHTVYETTDQTAKLSQPDPTIILKTDY